jgi:hypothetical protein
MLLNILHSGGSFWGVTAVFLFLEIILGYQLYKGSKSGTYVNDGAGGSISSKKNKPFYTNTFFHFMWVLLAIYIGALLIIASDYRGV